MGLDKPDDSKYHTSPLIFAINKGYEDTALFLLNYSSFNYSIPSNFHPPVVLAACKGFTTLVNAMLELETKENNKNNDNNDNSNNAKKNVRITLVEALTKANYMKSSEYFNLISYCSDNINHCTEYLNNYLFNFLLF